GIQLQNFVGGGEIFFLFRPIDNVRVLQPQHHLVGRDDHDFQAVDLLKFRGFRFRRSGHAGQLLVHAEIVLEGDGGQGLVLALDLDVFLGFDRLVQAIRPPPARHQASGELIHDDDFAILHYILDVALVQRVGLHSSIDVVFEVPVFGIGNVSDAQKLLDFFPANVSDRDALVLFVHHVVAGKFFRLARSGVNLLTLFQLGNDAIDPRIFVGGLFAGAGNNQRGAGLVDQDGIDLIDDGVVVLALHAIANIKLHVVAQVIEPELVVSAIGNVRGVGFAALFIIQIVHDDAHGQPQKA